MPPEANLKKRSIAHHNGLCFRLSSHKYPLQICKTIFIFHHINSSLIKSFWGSSCKGNYRISSLVSLWLVSLLCLFERTHQRYEYETVLPRSPEDELGQHSTRTKVKNKQITMLAAAAAISLWKIIQAL